MTGSLAHLNGRFLPAAEAVIPLANAGFVWGATVTDRVRTYGGRLFRIVDHLARFRASCETCRVPQPVSDAEITAIAERLVEHHRSTSGDDVTVVLFGTPGDAARERPTFGAYTAPITGAYARLLTDGAALVTPTVRHVPPQCVPRAAKIRSRMFWWIAEQEARETDSEAHALLLDSDDTVTETAAANFAIVRQGGVVTPPRSTVLDGVSMRVLEELCGELGIPFHASPLSLGDCESADEALVTSTTYGIAGVSRLNGKPIPWPGPVLARIHAAWSRLVGQDIWRQILPDR